ncbi:MAG: DUF1573 domain-containing protein [Bacteroidota bacterium]|nr:DUF1573 domain-containing protein [Flavisolibacter sp.]MBD0353120.1 DUF1573 domain-containing protein [Flavisolibacter sp.]MBD0374679.1 DUF1573 domain-containing protein [Flavisolibacter sp.]MDQ3847195.1 DUF1573 domain-containing protein [Bacteroidota bacterium]
MKRIYCFFLSFLILAVAQAQTTASDNSSLQFKEVEYDFGKIPQSKPVYHFFELVNTSSKPIKLDNVQASCGCTTPEWSRDEIQPGQSTKIKVGYNAANEGAFEKYITIQYNGNETKQIKIKGVVWKAPVGAPANASVQFLKQQTQ